MLAAKPAPELQHVHHENLLVLVLQSQKRCRQPTIECEAPEGPAVTVFVAGSREEKLQHMVCG